jgi:hypothetical protein
VATEPATPPEPVPPVVLHNRRPGRAWVWLVLAAFPAGACLCVVHPGLAIVGVLLVAAATAWPFRTQTVGMADLVWVIPANRHIAPQMVRSFEVGPDPLEDYADDDQPLCQLSICFQRGSPVRLIVTHDEASRALRWAAAKGVATRVTHDVERGG